MIISVITVICFLVNVFSLRQLCSLLFHTFRIADDTLKCSKLRAAADTTLDEEALHEALNAPDDTEDPLWIPELYLHQSDRTVLETEKEWLNDRIIYAGQLLIRQICPDVGGLSDPLLAEALRLHCKGKVFCQVLYNGSHHWITASSKNCSKNVVRVYDGMHQVPSVAIKQQIAALCLSSEPTLDIQCMNVERQRGGFDCGLLALAYATSICMDQDPVNVVYEQTRLRAHLLNCIVAQKITLFPVNSYRSVRKPISFSSRDKIYCSCRQLYVPGQGMIQCSSCHEWFHATCSALSDSAFDKAVQDKRQSYLCSACQSM